MDGFSGLDGADEAALILTNALANSTAAGYHRHWSRLSAYSAAQGCSAFPTAPATVVCYLGTLLHGGRISPASLQNYISPISTRHFNVGLPRLAVGRLIHSARVGFSLLHVRSVGALPLARRPLPAPVMWRILELAFCEPDFGWRVLWAALVAGFLVARRTAEVFGLERGDVTVTAAGGLHVQVRLNKGAERRTRLTRLVFEVCPSRDALPDLPVMVLRCFLADLEALRAPPSPLLFAPPGASRPPTADDVTAWLLAALRRLDISPPPGVTWCNYSTRAGGRRPSTFAACRRRPSCKCWGTMQMTRARHWRTTLTSWSPYHRRPGGCAAATYRSRARVSAVAAVLHLMASPLCVRSSVCIFCV